MKTFKFVTNDFLSPNSNYSKINYSNFNKEIRLKDDEVDEASKGQCARGLHVVPFIENIDFSSVIFSRKIIICEVEEEDIIFNENTGKMRVKALTPIREANEEEKQFIRNECCKNARSAYCYALDVDKKATNETRTACCKDIGYAYHYAVTVDGKATKETRKAVEGTYLQGYYEKEFGKE